MLLSSNSSPWPLRSHPRVDSKLWKFSYLRSIVPPYHPHLRCLYIVTCMALLLGLLRSCCRSLCLAHSAHLIQYQTTDRVHLEQRLRQIHTFLSSVMFASLFDDAQLFKS